MIGDYPPRRPITVRTYGLCDDPGPYAAHCTQYTAHHYSCYDAGKDVSWNHRQDFTHDCGDPACTPFTNEGD